MDQPPADVAHGRQPAEAAVAASVTRITTGFAATQNEIRAAESSEDTARTAGGDLSSLGAARQSSGNRFARERRLVSRSGLDWFRTPAWATDALLDRETFPGAVWECAAGDGAMADPIRARGYRVHATDVNPNRADVSFADFLAQGGVPEGCESIITNPPFKIGGAFALHALNLGASKVAMIQRLAFLEGQARERQLFRPHPPARCWVFSRRPCMWAGDQVEPPKGNGGMAFAWFVWERGHTGDTALRWIA